MASATAGLTRLNCLICLHQTPRSPEPSLATRWPAAQRPAVQKEKAWESRHCLKWRSTGAFRALASPTPALVQQSLPALLCPQSTLFLVVLSPSQPWVGVHT